MNTIEPAAPADPGGEGLAALEGEVGIPSVTRPAPASVSKRGVLAIVMLVLSLIAVSAVSINRALSSRKPGDDASKLLANRPAAAGGDVRHLDMTQPAPAPASASRLIPPILPTAEERKADPIPLRQSAAPKLLPQDAPVLLVSSRPAAAPHLGAGEPASDSSGMPNAGSLEATRRNLSAYQAQLQGVLDSLTKATREPTATTAGVPAAGPVVAPAPDRGGSVGTDLFDGELAKSQTPAVRAGMLSHRSLVLPKGTAFTCALKTRVVSATSGLIGCQVQRNVYGDDGRVLLVERGSHVDGEYRVASLRPGTVRIPVLWTRIRTPLGVTVDLDSPGTGSLGEAGIDGYVDNRWPERIGAAMLLSLIDDSVKLAIEERGAGAVAGPGTTIVLPSTTANASKLAKKVLDSTINIPPLIYQNQGGIVGVYVARDIDFSSVYELKASER